MITPSDFILYQYELVLNYNLNKKVKNKVKFDNSCMSNKKLT